MIYTTLTPQKTYLVSIAPNEEIVETLTAFVKERGIQSGYLVGIGAIKSTRVAHYSVTTKKYVERKMKKQLEITNLTGIITNDKVHIHATYSNQLMRGYVGHLVKAVVAAALHHKIDVIAIIGGVSANDRLRELFHTACSEAGISCHFPPPFLTGDNAGMIGIAAYLKLKYTSKSDDVFTVRADPNLKLV